MTPDLSYYWEKHESNVGMINGMQKKEEKKKYIYICIVGPEYFIIKNENTLQL